MAKQDEPFFYFAFGANMSSRVFRERRGVVPYSTEAAVLRDHRLAFDSLGIPFIEPAFASVVAERGSVVHGVLYTLDPRGFAKLDRVEGPGYRLRSLDVEGVTHGRVTAAVYQTREPRVERRPSARYLRLLLAGAREHGLPLAYIDELEAQPSVHVPGAARVITALLRVGEVVVPWIPRKKRTPER